MSKYLVIKKGYNEIEYDFVEKKEINLEKLENIKFILADEKYFYLFNNSFNYDQKFSKTKDVLKYIEDYNNYETLILELTETMFFPRINSSLSLIAYKYDEENEISKKYDIKEIEKRNLTKDTKEIERLENKLKKYYKEHNIIPNITFLVGSLAIMAGYVYSSFFSNTALNINSKIEKVTGLNYEQITYENGEEKYKIITENNPENFTDKIYYYEGYYKENDSYKSNVEVYNVITENMDELLIDATFTDDLKNLVNHLELSSTFISEVFEDQSIDPNVIYETLNINDKEAISEFVDKYDLKYKIGIGLGNTSIMFLVVYSYALLVSNLSNFIINKRFGKDDYQSISSELDAVKYQYKKLYGEEKPVQRKKNK